MISSDTTAPPSTASVPAPAWDDALLRNPHAVADKRKRVQRMFAAIAPSYDLNNRLHSLWMDQHWRNKAVDLAGLKQMDRVVDVACGTDDLTLAFFYELWWIGASASAKSGTNLPMRYPTIGQVTGIDFTFEMLAAAKKKYPTFTSGPPPWYGVS